MPRKGQRMLYRPVPSDFVETFIRIGWKGIEKHYHVHAKTAARWIDVCGREGLRKARADYVKENGYKRRSKQVEEA